MQREVILEESTEIDFFTFEAIPENSFYLVCSDKECLQHYRFDKWAGFHRMVNLPDEEECLVCGEKIQNAIRYYFKPIGMDNYNEEITTEEEKEDLAKNAYFDGRGRCSIIPYFGLLALHLSICLGNIPSVHWLAKMMIKHDKYHGAYLLLRKRLDHRRFGSGWLSLHNLIFVGATWELCDQGKMDEAVEIMNEGEKRGHWGCVAMKGLFMALGHGFERNVRKGKQLMETVNGYHFMIVYYLLIHDFENADKYSARGERHGCGFCSEINNLLATHRKREGTRKKSPLTQKRLLYLLRKRMDCPRQYNNDPIVDVDTASFDGDIGYLPESTLTNFCCDFDGDEMEIYVPSVDKL